MTNREQVDDYIKGAMAFPVKDEWQLLAMVLLRFSDLDGDTGEKMVAESLKRLKPVLSEHPQV